MTIAHLLEDFGHGDGQFPNAVAITAVSHDAIEVARLEAYEEGYKAGWDDAVGANTSEQLQLSEDLSQNLKDMAFTYQEAASHVTQTLGGILDELLGHFLPNVAAVALAPKTAEMIADLPLDAGSMPLTIAVTSENLKVMGKVADAVDHAPIDVVEDPDLTAGQVSLRFGLQEVALDFDALLSDVRDALSAALPTKSQEITHG